MAKIKEKQKNYKIANSSLSFLCHNCRKERGCTEVIPTFAQDVVVNAFESGTDQGSFDEFRGLAGRDAAIGFLRCHHGHSCWLLFVLLLFPNAKNGRVKNRRRRDDDPLDAIVIVCLFATILMKAVCFPCDVVFV